MKIKFLFATGLLLFISLISLAQERREIGNLILEDVPEVPETIKARIQQYQNTRSAGLVDWLPNGEGIMISTRFGNTTQLHTIDRPGGARNQITFFEEPVGNGSFCPDPKHKGFLFRKDAGGNEYAQIFWYDMDSRKAEIISDGTSVNRSLLWSNSGSQFAFTSTRRNQKDFDIYISEIASPREATWVVQGGNGSWSAGAWSPDDRKLIVEQYISITNSNAYLYDLETRSLEAMKDPDKETVFQVGDWNADGSAVYVVTDEGLEFNTLARMDLATGDLRLITDGIPWNVQGFQMNADRSRAVFVTNEGGQSQLYSLDPTTDAYQKVQGIPKGLIGGLRFHPGQDILGFSVTGTDSTGDVYSFDFKNKKLERWTYSEIGGLDTSTFPDAEQIRYPSFDTVEGKPRMIPAFVYRPKNKPGRLPVLIVIHGGPEGQHRPAFRSFYAYLAHEMGIAVIAPNVRGSRGYGKSYVKLDNGFKREDSVKDIGALIDWIIGNPDFDADRIAVYGGSYGGYMVLASMVYYNDKLKCGVDIVGISNFVTFLENTKDYRRDLRRVEYGDERDPEMRKHLEAISPNNHAEKITKPLFVIQGANDPRVPASESEQMVAAIRKNGGTVWYMLAKDEGHGFRKKANRDRMTEAIALFLQEHLLK